MTSEGGRRVKPTCRPATREGTARRALLAVLCIVAAGGACAEGARQLEPVVLQLKWQHQFQFAGYYAAVEKGFYRGAGLEVQLVECRPDQNPIDTVLDGEAQFGVASGEELVYRRIHGAPVVVLASMFQHSGSVLLTRGEPAITTPQGLAGRRVMLGEGPSIVAFEAMFRHEGIALDQLILLPHTFDVEDLIAGRTDAMTAYVTDLPYVLETRGMPFSVISPTSYGLDFYGDCLFTSETQLHADEDLVAALRDASLQGWRYAFENEDEVIGLLDSKYKTALDRGTLEYEAEAIRKLAVPDLIEVGHMNEGRWRRMAEVYAESGMAPKDYSLRASPITRGFRITTRCSGARWPLCWV